MAYIPPSHGSIPEWQRIVAAEINSRPWANLSVKSISAAYTVADGDDIVLCNATTAAFTVTLPAVAVFSGRFFTLKKTDASANVVTIDGNGAETIDGAATLALNAQYKSRTLYSDGTAWHVIGAVG